MFSLALSIPTIAATSAAAGAAAALIAQRVSARASERYTKWLSSYNPEDQGKIVRIENLYDQYLGQFSLDQESSIKSLTVTTEPLRYRVRESSLSTYCNFKDNIEVLCQQQKDLQLGYWFTDDASKSPECLVLEELKRWFTKISDKKTDESLLREVEARISYYSTLMSSEQFTWRGKFLRIIEINLQSLKQLRDHINAEMVRETLKLKLENIEIKGGDFLKTSLRFLFDVAKFNGLTNFEEGFSISLLSRRKELLANNFYGKLMLAIMSVKGFSECFESNPVTGYYLEDIQASANDEMAASFKELCKHIRNYTTLHVNLKHFKSLSADYGDRSVYDALRNQALGGRLNQAFEKLKEDFKSSVEASITNYIEKIKTKEQWYHIFVHNYKKTQADHIARISIKKGALESSIDTTHTSFLSLSSIPKIPSSKTDAQQKLSVSLERFIQLVIGNSVGNSTHPTGRSDPPQAHAKNIFYMAPGSSGSTQQQSRTKRTHDELDPEDSKEPANDSKKRIKIEKSRKK